MAVLGCGYDAAPAVLMWPERSHPPHAAYGTSAWHIMRLCCVTVLSTCTTGAACARMLVHLHATCVGASVWHDMPACSCACMRRVFVCVCMLCMCTWGPASAPGMLAHTLRLQAAQLQRTWLNCCRFEDESVRWWLARPGSDPLSVVVLLPCGALEHPARVRAHAYGCT